MHKFVLSTILLVLLSAAAGTSARAADRTLDGNGNNVAHPAWGQAGTQYLRVAKPNYADGIGTMVSAFVWIGARPAGSSVRCSWRCSRTRSRSLRA